VQRNWKGIFQYRIIKRRSQAIKCKTESYTENKKNQLNQEKKQHTRKHKNSNEG
jgi:hypothetical protein